MAAAPVLSMYSLIVTDMEAAVAFYETLGLKVPGGQGDWDRHHRSMPMPGGLSLDLDGEDFAKEWNRGWRGGNGRAGGVLGFAVEARDDVDRLYAALTGAGYRGQQEPYDAFWGSRYAVVEDPDGNAVGLMSPQDDRYAGAPPPLPGG